MQPQPPVVVLAVDPGSHKCGLAVVDEALAVHERRVVETEALAGAVHELLASHPVTHLVTGNRTGSRRVLPLLRELAGGRPVLPVEEHLTSVEARQRYFRENPPRGWRRLIPLGLQVPPCPVDDYAAVLLAERFLGERQ